MTDRIDAPDWRQVVLHAGILREPSPEDGRLVLWLPTERDGNCQCWQRVSTVPRAAIERRQGLCAIAATTIQARQQIRRFFVSLMRRLRHAPGDCEWLLPNGETAEQCGARQTDLLLVWAEYHHLPLDETRIREDWPQSTRVESLGPNLFLLWGVAAPAANNGTETLPSEDPSQEQAEQWLAAARRSGDRSGEASALTDLGLLALEHGDVPHATVRLEEALTLARALGDRGREGDVQGNLGLASIAAGQFHQARQHLEQALTLARTAEDRFAQKLTLERLGTAHAGMGDLPTALDLLTEALLLARALSDRQHEADLLWHLAIRRAELGQPAQALEYGQAAVQLLESLGKPHAHVYAEHLQKYRQGEASGAGGRLAMAGVMGQTVPGSVSLPARMGPGFLRMAISAGKALARFVGSGLKTVSAEMFRKRLQQCAGCNYHTGLRCRICGCFTNLKARLPHEECPLGKWSALTSPGSSRPA